MKLIAYYLPQFHAIPENDAWWGPGFTEWTNTRAAKPLWNRHHQPREPHGDHYYDLTDPAVHEWQADLARSHGIHAFCYYHYWFNGRRLLERPLETVLERKKPDFPFCVSWANEPWTRTWTGGDRDTLMPQEYGDEVDWRRHYECLRRYFLDPRYLRSDGRPMLLIYRATSIPCLQPMLKLWREMAVADGLGGLFIVAMMSIFLERKNPPPGFDAFQEFEPLNTMKRDLSLTTWAWRNVRHRLRKHLGPKLWLMDRYGYDDLWSRIVRRDPPNMGAPIIPGAFVDWDNTARKKLSATTVMNGTPAKFRGYLSQQIRRAKDVYGSDMLFINAWNEWAEGTYLEPDKRHGTAYLEAVAAAMRENGYPVPAQANRSPAREATSSVSR